MSKEANVREIQQKALKNSMKNLEDHTTTKDYNSEIKDPSFLNHQTFLVENDCWVILVVRNHITHTNFHYTQIVTTTII